MSDTDERSRCENVGCDNPPAEGGYCAECIDISPNLLDGDHGEDTDTEPADSPDVPRESSAEGENRDADPCRETGESVSLADAPTVETDVHPSNVAETWHAWKPEVSVSDGERSERKVPRAPWLNPEWPDKFVDAQNPDVWTDRETAAKWCDHLPGYGLAHNIRDREDHPDERGVLIDYDDARDPETERVHPTVREHIERAGSYADVSTSGTGVHILARGELPGGPVTDELPDHPDFPDAEIEVYDTGRFVAMTGQHLAETPTEVRDVQALIDDLADEYATKSESTPDAVLHEPEKSRAEVRSVETTTDAQDVYDAIQHTGPRDIRLRSPVTEERRDSKSLDPSWTDSDSGTRLAQVDDGWVYRKGMHGLDALQVVALEERIIHHPDEYPSGEDFGEAVEALRDRGAHIPEYDGPVGLAADADPVAVLPELSPKARAAAWGGLSTDDSSETVTLPQQEVYDRVHDDIADAMRRGDNVVIDAIMGGGKTFNWFGALATRDEQGAYFSPRIELYEQATEYAEANGFDSDDWYIMPSLKRDCPTWQGDHGPDQERLIKSLYRHGVRPKTIHNLLGDELGCRQDGKCEYEHRCDFDPDEYQLLIGHYAHAHLPYVTAGRHCAFDEDPAAAFTTRIEGDMLTRGVNAFLDLHDSPPFDGWDDLIQHRNDPDRQQAGLDWYDEAEGGAGFDFEDPDEQNAVRFRDDGFHAYAPHAVYAILAAEPLESGYQFEQAHMPGLGNTARFFTTSEEHGTYYVEFQTPPDLSYTEARGVTCLDGTPLVHDGTAVEWENALDRPLNHRQVLTDDERATFLSETQGNVYIQSSPYVKPYSSGKHTNPTEDAAVLAAVRDEYGNGDPPVVFTDKSARDEYEDRGFVDEGLAATFDYPGNLRGSDEYGDCRLGVQLGSSHHGDHEVRRRAAALGETVEPEGKGIERDYGSELGNSIVYQMREAQSAQNALRVGRDGDGAVFVFHTCAFPDWIPVEDGVADVSLWTDGQHAVREVWTDFDSDHIHHDGASAAALAEYIEDIGKRTVHRALNRFVTHGLLTKVDDPEDSRRSLWIDDGLASLDTHAPAEIEFPDVETGCTGDDGTPSEGGAEDDDIERMSVYTRSGANTLQKRPVSEPSSVSDNEAGDSPPIGHGPPR
jgi:hypothetical protein